MKKAIEITVIIFFFGIKLCYSQRNKHIIDSLEKVIKTQKDSNLVKSYCELTWQYRLVNRSLATNYGYKAIALAKKINSPKWLAQAYNDLGIIFFDKENYDSSIQLYQNALKIREASKDELGIARLYNKIGIVYQRQGKFSEALYNQQQALQLFEKVNDNIGISYSLNNIGILQQNLGRYNEAIEYQTKSIAIKKKLNDQAGLLQSYINIANIYKIQEEYTKAENYYSEAETLARKLNNKEYLSNALNNLGDLLSREKKYAKALQLVKESYEIRVSTNDTKGTVSCLNNLGYINLELEKYDTAEAYLLKALSLAKVGINTKPELMVTYQTLSKVNEKKGITTASLNYFKQYADLKDSIFNDGLSNKFAELETKYQTLQKEKKIEEQQNALTQNLYQLAQQKLLISQNELQLAANELEIKSQQERILQKQFDSTNQAQQINLLNKENKINALQLTNEKLENNRKNILLAVISIVSLLAILLLYSFYRRYKLKKEQQLQATIFKQQELATKAVLEAEENERKRIASDLHDGIGQMMSAAKMNLSAMEAEIPFTSSNQKAAYDKAIQLVDESCKEVRAVSHNMMPNALLKAGLASAVREFVNQIDSRVIKIDMYAEGLQERLATDVETVLYRVIQECVNNVIKHAQATHLDISIIKDETGIAVTIEDNGKGFNTSDTAKFEGIGLKNMQTRIAYLKGTIEWNSAVNKGTLVAIHLPIV